MKKKAPLGPVMRHCRNEAFGCGRSVDEAKWNRRVTACFTCCQSEARRWRLKPADLDYLVVAYMIAKSHANGGTPHADAVLIQLGKMGVHQEDAMDGALPERDRAAAV